MSFSITLSNVAMMIFYMACGMVLVKSKLMQTDHARSLSGMLIYLCNPAMIINAFQTMSYEKNDFRRMCLFFCATVVVQLLFFGILYLLLHKKYEDAKYRILTCGGILGNVGFFGLPLVQSLFPNEPIVSCYATMYVTSMNIIVFTVGVFLITGDKRYVSVKTAILNPTTLSAVFGILLYLFGIRFPEPLAGGISLLGKMTTPICMIILGMRLSSVKIKKLFERPFVYVVCALKLIVYPIFCYLCVCFLPLFTDTEKLTLFVLSAAPAGAVILSLAELHGKEQELSANVVLLTTLSSVVTIPLMSLLINLIV